LASRPGFEYHQWDRRQDISACESPCAWAANLASCSETDLSCYCKIVDAAGSNVAACAACLQPINATLADGVEQVATICEGSVPPGASGSTTPSFGGTPTTAGTTGISTGNPTSCSAQCANIATALTACPDVTCFCPTLLASGSACSQCFATVNVTEASLLSVAISECKTVPITSTAATQCSQQCGLVYIAATSCSQNSCFCPTFLAQGPQCSSCWATVNTTEASIIGSIYTACQTELYPTLTTSSTGGSTPTIILSPTTTSKSGAYPARGIFGDILGTTGMQFAMFIALVAALLTLFG
jgi:hypothetical protein